MVHNMVSTHTHHGSYTTWLIHNKNIVNKKTWLVHNTQHG